MIDPALIAARRRRAQRNGRCAASCPDATRPGSICLEPDGHEGEHYDKVMDVMWSRTAEPWHSDLPGYRQDQVDAAFEDGAWL